MDYFRKNDKMIAISRYYSMGVGNGIGLSITTSGPLPEKPARLPANPPVTITSDWATYSSPDVGLELQYPPNWRMRDDSVPYERTHRRTKYLNFGAKDYTGNFRITMEPVDPSHPGPVVHDNDDPEPKCFPSSYQISGLPGRACVLQYEVVGDETCTRYLETVEVQTSKYHLSFDPPIGASFPGDSNQYKLTDLYEKILSTIKLEQ